MWQPKHTMNRIEIEARENPQPTHVPRATGHQFERASCPRHGLLVVQVRSSRSRHRRQYRNPRRPDRPDD